MVRWLVIAVLLWLVLLSVLTLIAIFRHSSSSHAEPPAIVALG